jgi:hypothetical protein
MKMTIFPLSCRLGWGTAIDDAVDEADRAESTKPMANRTSAALLGVTQNAA